MDSSSSSESESNSENEKIPQSLKSWKLLLKNTKSIKTEEIDEEDWLEDYLILKTASYKYLATNEEFSCPICTEPFINPVVHTKCGNTFCRKCLRKVESKRCPMCRGELVSSKIIDAPKLIINQLSKLIVICPVCQKQVERGNCSDHLKKCKIPCILDCTMLIEPVKMSTHTSQTCKFRKVSCSAKEVGCSWEGKSLELTEHEKSCDVIKNRKLYEKIKNLEDMVEFLQKQVVKLGGKPYRKTNSSFSQE